MAKKDPEDEPYDPKKHDHLHHGHPINSDAYNVVSEETWNKGKSSRANK